MPMSAVLEPARTAACRLHRPLLLLVVSAVGTVIDDRVLLGARFAR
ncbi:hypothetical protein AB0L44_37705 [Nonomuraea wenchangensis]